MPRYPDPELEARIIALYQEGQSPTEIADGLKLGYAHPTGKDRRVVTRILQRRGIPRRGVREAQIMSQRRRGKVRSGPRYRVAA